MSKDTETEFDAFAADYDRSLREGLKASGEMPDYFAEYKVRYLLRRALVGPGSRILDFGCGTGHLIRAFRRLMPAVAVDGYDPSTASLEQIAPEARGKGRFSADLADLGSAYDIAVLAGVLHHIQPERRTETLKAVCARLRPGGVLAVFEHNPFNPLTRRTVDACPFDKNAVLLRAMETKSLLAATGLILAAMDYIVFFPRALSVLRPLEPALGWFPLGAQYAVVGRRDELARASGP